MAIWHTFFVMGMASLVFYGFGEMVNRLFEKKKYGIFSALSLLFFAIFFVIKKQIETRLFPEFYDLPAFDMNGSIELFASIYILVVMGLSALVHLIENHFKKEKRVQEMIRQQNEAQLQFLKAQINPHFLFNTLNNIYSLSLTGSPQTPNMILKLSDLLRYVVYESKYDKVLLEKEVKHIKKYTELVQMKSEHPLDIQIEVKGDIEGVMIEPMILIPLVENCFKHCDFDTNESAFTRIILEIRNGSLIFKTQNSKNEIDTQKDTVGGVGLENIKRRLNMYYPNRHVFEIQNDSKFFAVNLSLKQ